MYTQVYVFTHVHIVPHEYITSLILQFTFMCKYVIYIYAYIYVYIYI